MSPASGFKEFAMRGNVIDLAVGVVIGAAFGRIVSSLVGNAFIPVAGVLTGGVNFSTPRIAIATSPKGEPVLLKYGAFIQAVVDFLIVAFVIFVAVSGINRLKKPLPAAIPEVSPLPRQEVLLEEIRNLLATR